MQPRAGATAEEKSARVERYAIDINFQPERSFLHARAEVTLRSSQPLEAIEFELNPSLKILEVTDARGRAVHVERSGRLGSPKLLVRLAESSAAAGAEQTATLTFTYEGVLPRRQLDYITKDGILLRDEARWYPAVDLAAFTQNRLSITVPSGWEAYTSGEPQGFIGTGLAATYLWKTSRPVSSRSIVCTPKQPIACAIEPMQKEGNREAQRPNACVTAADGEAAKRAAVKATGLLQGYSQAIAPYAGAQVRIVQGFPGLRGAWGYSAPGLLVVSEDVVKFADHPAYAEFLPHEIAHQWFPIEVTLAGQEDGWLAEGLAEYLALRSLEQTKPEQARQMVARALKGALGVTPLRPLSLGLRLFALENWNITYATLYQRGMFVFRTLESVVGRDKLDAALGEFYRRKSGGPASIADFQKICEELSGVNLGWFFRYFIEETRIPEIELRRLPAKTRELAGEIRVRDVPAEFHARVTLRLSTASGRSDHEVEVRGPVTPFSISTKQPVILVALDPEFRILRRQAIPKKN